MLPGVRGSLHVWGLFMGWRVVEGDVLLVLGGLEDGVVDSIVTDPPYALDFMGKDWDSFGGGERFQAWCEGWAAECFRVLKPGGFVAAFGGTRTYHRLACAIEDAGFEIRDSLHWIYGSGFPKSLDVSKAIDKAAGAEREVIGERSVGRGSLGNRSRVEQGYRPTELNPEGRVVVTASATPAAAQWEGWGTALKPSHEPIVLARKPLTGTVAANVLEHGTGALNIDGCRIETTDHWEATGTQSAAGVSYAGSADGSLNVSVSSTHPGGRWPPNILLTHSPDCPESGPCAPGCPVAEMDRQSGISTSKSSTGRQTAKQGTAALGNFTGTDNMAGHDSGGASRFFPVFRYQAKAPTRERPHIEGIPAHPTVKPLGLMMWLTKLVTPPGGLILDPFAGTGTTGEAAVIQGFDCLLIEKEPAHVKLIEARMGRVIV